MSMTLDALDFDPYREWLNVIEPQRPVAPYDLLALAPLESDPHRIKAGYLRQQAAMLKHAERADPKVWESISREIEDAFTLLSDPEQKAVLDAAIRRKTGGRSNGKPASAAELTVNCRHCHRASPAQKRFCGGCGQSLWETCPQCQTQCAADERFCGTCGADILGGLSQQSRELQQKLDEAQALVAEYRYDAAISCLRGVAAVPDPRFEKWAQQALSEISRTEQHRAAQRATAEQAWGQAKRHMESHAYEAVAVELDRIPAPLRSPEVTTLLERARGARQEIAQVAAEIRSALEDKRTAELLPKINRLLTLKPDHKQALQIAEQLRDKLVRQAKQQFHACQYRECLDQLHEVAPVVCSDEVATLRDSAGELLALLDGVRTAALADRATLGLADRLVKLAPANDEAARLRSRLAERMQARPDDPRYGAPNFAPPPRRTPIGIPVDWLASASRFMPADERVAAALRERPGQFFVALGLALQGLGEAAVPIDLAPSEKVGMLPLLSGLLSSPVTLSRKTVSAAWGLDLSDSALKAIKLVSEPGEGGVKVAACEHLAHSESLRLPDGDIGKRTIFEQTLKGFLARVGEVKGAKVCVNLSGQHVLGRFFDVPPLPAKKVADAITYEAQHQLPIALDELCWASQILDPVESKLADDRPRRVMVTAARQAVVRDLVAMFRAAGIQVDQVQSDGLALHNAIVYEALGPADNATASQAVCTLDVGMRQTNVVISSPQSVWFRTFGQGGDSFTNQLIKQFNMTHAQADEIKREPARARRYGQLCDAMRPLFVQLASEVQRSLANYNRLFRQHPVRQIYGVGGAFATHGLLRHLRSGK